MIYFSSDQHFDHHAVVSKGWREGFSSTEDHDNHLLELINSTVDRNDRLFLLGDFCLKQPQKYRGLIRCKNITLIRGNHDKIQLSVKAFGSVHDYYHIKKLGLVNRGAFLCHYPMAFWHKSHYGDPHFYGHVHAKEEENLDKIWPERRSMDIGVDNAKRLLGDYRPFSEQEVLDAIMWRHGHEYEKMQQIKELKNG